MIQINVATTTIAGAHISAEVEMESFASAEVSGGKAPTTTDGVPLNMMMVSLLTMEILHHANLIASNVATVVPRMTIGARVRKTAIAKAIGAMVVVGLDVEGLASREGKMEHGLHLMGLVVGTTIIAR